MKKVLYIFDRVTHYNEELFLNLEPLLRRCQRELVLLSGVQSSDAVGRVGLNRRIIDNEHKFRLRELQFGTYTLRLQQGVIGEVYRLKPHVIVMASHVGNVTSWLLMELKRIVGSKLVAWQCGYEFNPSWVKDRVLRRFIRGFDYHLAYHSNAREYAIKYGAAENRTVVMHNTINEEKVEVLPKKIAREMIEQKHPEIAGRRILLFVGALLKEKRLDIVLDALSKLAEAKIVFVIVGNGPYMNALQTICRERRDVIFAGAVIDGVGLYFDAADVFILPGTGGLAINEAMAHSLPIICGYADGSADDLVVHERNGFRLNHGTSAEVAEALQILFAQEKIREEFGRVSRRLITTKFSYQNYLSTVAELLSTV